jgi:hypothetical protein
MERMDSTRLRDRLLRAGRRLQQRKRRPWFDGRARPEDREAVERLIREGHDELRKR